MIETRGVGRFGAYRRLLGLGRRKEIPVSREAARSIVVGSGKGGTGKSVLASNLAILRSQRGERVLLVDFDAGMANAHLLLGLAPRHDLGHVMRGDVDAHGALVPGPGGLQLLSGGVGRDVLANPTRRELDRLFETLQPLEYEFDLIIFDHGAGLGYALMTHLAATSTLLIVTNPEVTALSDAYALYKRAHKVNPYVRSGLVLNRALSQESAESGWERFRGAAHRFLGHSPEWIDWIPTDPAVQESVEARVPISLSNPDAEAARSLARIAEWGPLDHAKSARPFFERARGALR